MQKQQLAMQMEQLKKDREDSERRIMEIANTSQEMLIKKLESRTQAEIEAQRKAEEQATAVGLETEKVKAENAERRKEEAQRKEEEARRKEEEARLKEAKEMEEKQNKEYAEKE